jgi:hypothetical protein
MYYSSDGGQTWSVDASTGAEMKSCASEAVAAGTYVWCAGSTYNGVSFNGVVYRLRVPSAQ